MQMNVTRDGPKPRVSEGVTGVGRGRGGGQWQTLRTALKPGALRGGGWV